METLLDESGPPWPILPGEEADRPNGTPTIEEAGSIGVPSAQLGTLLALTAGVVDEAAVRASVGRAVKRARDLRLGAMPPSERAELLRAAIECLVAEAVQFTKLAARHRKDTPAAIAVGAAAGGDPAPGATAEQAAPDDATTEARGSRRLGIIDAGSVEGAMQQVLSHLAGDDAAAAAMLGSEAGRELLSEATATVDAVAAAAIQRAVSDATAAWEGAREEERASERARGEQTLAQAVRSVREEAGKEKEAAVAAAVDEIRRCRGKEIQTAVDAAVREAVGEARDLCVAEARAAQELAVKEAFERGKAAVGRSAEKAMLVAAQQQAREAMRKEVANELRSAEEAAARAAGEITELKAQLAKQSELVGKVAKEAMVKALPVQRAATEAAVAEAVRAERKRFDETKVNGAQGGGSHATA